MLPWYPFENYHQGNNMAQIETLELSDTFWAAVEPLIPHFPRIDNKSYKRRPGGGRKPKYSNRLYFTAIIYVLRTGIIWNALPREKFAGLGSAAVHRKFQQWTQAGVFHKLWLRGLAEYEEMEGIAWHWQGSASLGIKSSPSEDSAAVALAARQFNPAGREKKRKQVKSAGQREWRPFVTSRQRRQPI